MFKFYKLIVAVFFVQILFSSCGDPVANLIYFIENNSTDTIYVEKPCFDDSLEQTVVIKNKSYYKINPKSGVQYFRDDKIGYPGEKDIFNKNFDSKLNFIKGNDTTDFVFAVKDKCEITIDGQIGTFTRIIDKNFE